MFLPDIYPYASVTPTFAYLCGTDTMDNVRIMGFIDEDGMVTDVSVHVGDAMIGKLVQR